MIFDYPLLLLLAPVVAVVFGVVAWVARRRRIVRAAAWSSDVGARARGAGRWTPLVVGAVALLGAIALAGPRGGRSSVTTESRALSVALAVDISRSMLAEDAQPNRLLHASREARRLVQDLPGDRIGLIAFAGRSYILSPLTVDAGALMLFLDGLSPDIASTGGTGLAGALNQGGQLLSAADEAGDRVLVLMTDGEAHDTLSEVLDAARQLKRLGVRLVLVAEGDTRPVPIPVRDSTGALIEYQVDDEGTRIETSRRDDVLQAVADAAEGALVPAQLPDQAGAVRDLLAAFARSPSRETRTADLQPLAWIPLLIAVLLLGLQTTLRRTAALIGIAGLMVVTPAHAQRLSAGERALADGHPLEAAQLLFKTLTPSSSDTAYYNAGTAALAAGHYNEARRALTKAATSLEPGLRYRALYNLGVTALSQSRKEAESRDSLLAEAAEHLKEALTLAPGSERAKWNLELAMRHRPPPPSGGNSPKPPPPQSNKPNPPPGGQGGGASPPTLTQSQAEEILGSVDREERNARERRMARNRSSMPVVKDW
jgi:Ca-activated chloride channel homolog